MNLFRSRDKPPDWVIDSVIQYVCSPLFSTPVLDFIEDRCVVFDSSEENKFSYTDAHQDFGKLIDYQLANFMDETGINPNDFASALALDINSHQGVNNKALKNAFKHIEAVDNFILFKNIMVSTNEELNNRALEMIQRSGMFTPSIHSRQVASRFSDTPPPPYSGYEEDGVRNLISDDEVESFVRNLSNNLQVFDDTVREQQEYIQRNIGIQLGDVIQQTEQLNFTESSETTNEPTPNRLYPNLEFSLNDPTQPLIPISNAEFEEIISPAIMDNIIVDPSTMDNNQTDLIMDNTQTVPITNDDIPTDSITTDDIQTDPCTLDNLIADLTMDNNITTPSTMDNTITDASKTGLQDTFVEQECITPLLTDNKFKLPELPSQQKQRIGMSSERDREEVKEETNQSEERAQSPVEAADSLTQQWMEYAKEQKYKWSSSMEECDKDKAKPSERDLVDREDHFKRQRDLLRKQRKQQRVAEQTTTTTTATHVPSVPDGNLVSPVDTDKEKVMADDARKFRRALSAKLKREVVNRHSN